MTRLTTGGIYGVGCEIDGFGLRRGIDAWRFDGSGEIHLLCWQHAAQLLAVWYGLISPEDLVERSAASE